MNTAAIVSVYADPAYAKSLSEWGTVLRLPRSGGCVLERVIPGARACDAMGCYPLFACGDWSRLAEDLVELKRELVSLAVVTDPFGNYDAELLSDTFRDLVIPFKQHFVIDLTLGHPNSFVSRHHERNVRKALRRVSVEVISSVTDDSLAEWMSLYRNLIERHGIRGMTAFSESSFAQQLTVPGAVVFRAMRNRRAVGMNIWYVGHGVGYYHLGAFNKEGYNLGASFALFWRAINYFSDRKLHWLCLGAGTGLEARNDGLSRFKRGWATGTRPTYFCGRIFNQQRYAELSLLARPKTHYFPAYRAGEFGS